MSIIDRKVDALMLVYTGLKWTSVILPPQEMKRRFALEAQALAARRRDEPAAIPVVQQEETMAVEEAPTAAALRAEAATSALAAQIVEDGSAAVVTPERVGSGMLKDIAGRMNDALTSDIVRIAAPAKRLAEAAPEDGEPMSLLKRLRQQDGNSAVYAEAESDFFKIAELQLEDILKSNNVRGVADWEAYLALCERFEGMKEGKMRVTMGRGAAWDSLKEALEDARMLKDELREAREAALRWQQKVKELEEGSEIAENDEVEYGEEIDD